MSAPRKVLVTCPPMVRMIDEFSPLFKSKDWEVFAPKVVQTMSIPELKELLPQYDGWIIGDDPTNREILEAGLKGRFKAAVKWGVGTDNIDYASFKDLQVPIMNTPQMFGGEVADVALGYLLGLARDLFTIDRGIRQSQWPKPAGMSLRDRTVALVGFGDIGKSVAKRLMAFDMKVIAYDPGAQFPAATEQLQSAEWPKRLNEADFIVFTCALTPKNRHMLNKQTLDLCKPGVRVINVARGPLINETDLISALESGHVAAAGLDVFEVEPLPADSPLRKFGDRMIFGSHNGSNTKDAVIRASHQAIATLEKFLNEAKP